MKISHSVREIYSERRPVYESLKIEVDRAIDSFKRSNWHYESRVKNLESFALKAETGRYEMISNLEDFFGGCLVVENSSALKAAESLLCEKFKLIERRPKDPAFTHKAPSSFIFDDIRLYLVRPHDEMLPEKSTDNVVFEIQIKTFLQHAWAIATHDMVYKGGTYNWSSSRIAFQVKAMLEHAELSIANADSLSPSLHVESNKEYKKVNSIIRTLRNRWPSESLPEDLVRLSQNIYSLLSAANLNIGDLNKLCDESPLIGDSPMLDLSPYTAIAVSILISLPSAVETLNQNRIKIFMPEEVLEKFGDSIEGIGKEVLMSAR